jgi:hypothetical protein
MRGALIVSGVLPITFFPSLLRLGVKRFDGNRFRFLRRLEVALSK